MEVAVGVWRWVGRVEGRCWWDVRLREAWRWVGMEHFSSICILVFVFVAIGL